MRVGVPSIQKSAAMTGAFDMITIPDDRASSWQAAGGAKR